VQEKALFFERNTVDSLGTGEVVTLSQLPVIADPEVREAGGGNRIDAFRIRSGAVGTEIVLRHQGSLRLCDTRSIGTPVLDPSQHGLYLTELGATITHNEAAHPVLLVQTVRMHMTNINSGAGIREVTPIWGVSCSSSTNHRNLQAMVEDHSGSMISASSRIRFCSRVF
jgi:hypothetical protein